MNVKVKNITMIIDDEDYPKLMGRKVFLVNGYCRISIKHKHYSVHRIIIDCPKNYIVDHKNGIKHDNRKENLRLCNYSKNGANRKPNSNRLVSKIPYKGVHYQNNHYKNRMKPWVSRLAVNGKRIYIGMFETPELAARAYDKEAIKQFGEFAKTNFEYGNHS